jgi:hypothetical protein
MPGVGTHRWEFVGKQPVIFTIVVVLLFANVSLSFALAFFVKFLFPGAIANSQGCPAMASDGIQYRVPAYFCSYANWSEAITFILLGLAALIMFIFRENVRRVR